MIATVTLQLQFSLNGTRPTDQRKYFRSTTNIIRFQNVTKNYTVVSNFDLSPFFELNGMMQTYKTILRSRSCTKGTNADLILSFAEVTFRQKNKIVLRQSDTKSECFKTITTLKPYQQSGKPQGNGKWPLNRCWLLNRGKGNGRFHIGSLITGA